MSQKKETPPPGEGRRESLGVVSEATREEIAEIFTKLKSLAAFFASLDPAALIALAFLLGRARP